MAETKKFDPITDDDIAGNDIASLKTRPNLPKSYGGDGMSAADLKARFDKLVKRVIAEYNTLANILNGKDGVDATSYITLKAGEGGKLRDLLDKIVNADGALILDDRTISDIITEIRTLIGNVEADIGDVDEGTNLADLIGGLQTTIGTITEGTTVAALISALQGDVGDVDEGTNLASIIGEISAKDSVTNKHYISTSDVVASSTITAPTIHTAKILPKNTATSVQLGDAVVTGFEAQVKGDLVVSDHSKLGLTAKVVNAEGTPTVTLDGNTGTVSASTVAATTANVTYLNATNVTATDNTTTGLLYVDQILSKDPESWIKVGSDTHFEENVEIYGQLNVWGNVITRDYETLLTPSNIIVVNSDGTNLSRSGLVIRTSYDETENDDGDYEYPAVAILYDKDSKAICVGEGILTERYPEVDGGEVDYSFNYSDKADGTSEAIPLAARDGFDGKGGYLPVWDAGKNAFVPSNTEFKTAANVDGSLYKCFEIATDASAPSDAKPTRISGQRIETYSLWSDNLFLRGSKVATESYVTDQLSNQLSDLAEFLRKVNEGGLV